MRMGSSMGAAPAGILLPGTEGVNEGSLRAVRDRVSLCGAPRSDLRVSPGDASRWMRRRSGASGWSNGGVFAIAVVNGPSLERARKRGVTLPAVGFRLGIGISPGGCFSLVKEVVVAPLLVLIGAADDWTLATTCEEMVNAMRAKGADATIRIFPGAYHYFDNADYPLQMLPDVENRNKPGDCCGATVGYQREAAAAAFTEVEAFLAKHLK